MTFREYAEEKILFILFMVTFIFGNLLILLLAFNNLYFTLTLIFIQIALLFFYLIIDYKIKLKKRNEIHSLVDGLKEKYYISEILARPRAIENEGYYYALKKACKSMNDEICYVNNEKQEYQEYVETFAHEIKTPISAVSLYCDNTNNEEIKIELDKINNLVEQMLYYARSENTEKDYFVKKLVLEQIVHPVIVSYKDHLLKNGIKLEVKNLNKIVYTDEKWVTFIISQIIQNSIKYIDNKNKKIVIDATENKFNIVLSIKDNGIGISEADVLRVFEKGFTGNKRNKKNSTGIGLYLCKKLCDRLNLKINIESQLNVGTTVFITFPKNNLN